MKSEHDRRPSRSAGVDSRELDVTWHRTSESGSVVSRLAGRIRHGSVIMLLVITASIVPGEVLPSLTPKIAAAEQVSSIKLKNRLMSGLKVSHPNEKAFIEEIVRRVERKQIPATLVDSTYFWVYQNQSKFRYPFFNFELILRKRAKPLHVYIPPYTHPSPGTR